MSDHHPCICANAPLVASTAHPYCYAHAHPDVDADAAKWRRVQAMFEDPTCTDRDLLVSVALEMPVDQARIERIRRVARAKAQQREAT